MKEYKIEMKLSRWVEAYHPNLLPLSYPRSKLDATCAMLEYVRDEYKEYRREHPNRACPTEFRVRAREISEWETIHIESMKGEDNGTYYNKCLFLYF